MKGIILAGGLGTRLFPITRVTSKHLLPVYDKPMVYYPLSTLMLAGIRDILVISTPRDLGPYQALLGTGEPWGLKITYAPQETAGGIAQALLIGKDHIGDDSVGLVLGDNIFYAQGLSEVLQRAVKEQTGATVFGYHVKDPTRYGVAVFDDDGDVVDIEEKPSQPKSNYAIVGLYLYDNKAAHMASQLKPSGRGEVEITDLNRAYLAENRLKLVKMGRGAAWFDAGTHQALLEASNFIATIEHRQGLKVSCLEEVAYRMGFIDRASFERLAHAQTNPDYSAYLKDILVEIGDGR